MRRSETKRAACLRGLHLLAGRLVVPCRPGMHRAVFLTLFTLALIWAQPESGAPALGARLKLVIDPIMPARVYLCKDGQRCRFSPIQALLPLHVDRFYRERLWTSSPSPDVLSTELIFRKNEQRDEFFTRADGTTIELRQPLSKP